MLTETAMYNKALHPIYLYSAAHLDHASPFFAFLDQVFERIPGFKTLKASGGGVTAEAEMASSAGKSRASN